MDSSQRSYNSDILSEGYKKNGHLQWAVNVMDQYYSKICTRIYTSTVIILNLNKQISDKICNLRKAFPDNVLVIIFLVAHPKNAATNLSNYFFLEET